MNIPKVIYLNCGETYEDMIDQTPSTGILRTHKVTSSQMLDIVQSVGHCTGIAELMGSNPVEP